MKLTLTVVLLFGMTGCKSKQEAFFDEQIALDNDLMDILDTVKDDFTAEEARPKLQQFIPRYTAHIQKVKTLEHQTPEEWEKLSKKYEEPLRKLRERMDVNIPKIRKYNLGRVPAGGNPLLR
jgi:hypothetical protein